MKCPHCDVYIPSCAACHNPLGPFALLHSKTRTILVRSHMPGNEISGAEKWRTKPPEGSDIDWHVVKSDEVTEYDLAVHLPVCKEYFEFVKWSEI